MLKIWGEEILKGHTPKKRVSETIDEITEQLAAWGKGTVGKYKSEGRKEPELTRKRRVALEKDIKKKTKELYSLERAIIEKSEWIRSAKGRRLTKLNWWPVKLVAWNSLYCGPKMSLGSYLE